MRDEHERREPLIVRVLKNNNLWLLVCTYNGFEVQLVQYNLPFERNFSDFLRNVSLRLTAKMETQVMKARLVKIECQKTQKGDVLICIDWEISHANRSQLQNQCAYDPYEKLTALRYVNIFRARTRSIRV